MKLNVESLENRILTAPCNVGWIVSRDSFVYVPTFIAGIGNRVMMNMFADPPSIDDDGNPERTCRTPENTYVDFGYDGNLNLELSNRGWDDHNTVGHNYEFAGHYMITLHIGDDFEYSRPVVVNYFGSHRENLPPVAGDVNNDQVFNSSDLVKIFEAGKYETDEPASWLDGDWNMDERFTSTDLVFAMRDSGYDG